MNNIFNAATAPWLIGVFVLILFSLFIYLIVHFFKLSNYGFALGDTGSKTDNDITAIEKNVILALQTYHRMAVQLHLTYVLLGALAIISSVFVTTFIADKNSGLASYLPYISFVSTASLTLITAFNLGTKGNNCRNAWRHLEKAFMSYKADKHYTIDKLIQAKAEAEIILGGVDFQYNPNKS